MNPSAQPAPDEGRPHLQAEQLLRKPAGADPTGKQFDGILEQLIEAVEHHVRDEESTVLPAMRERLADDRRQQLGMAFAASRASQLTGRVGQLSREQLAKQAENLDLSGTSSMSRQQLEKQINKQA